MDKAALRQADANWAKELFRNNDVKMILRSMELIAESGEKFGQIPEGCPRSLRLLSRAYLRAFNFRCEDDNDLADPLTHDEGRRVRKLSRVLRTVHGLPDPVDVWADQTVDGLGAAFSPAMNWCAQHPGPCFFTGAWLFLFFCVFGFAAPFEAVIRAVLWVYGFDKETWHGIAIGAFCILTAIPILGAIANVEPDVPARTVPAPALPTGTEYRRKTDTVHGDARAADDWEIDEALRDRTGGFQRMFED